MPPLRRVTVFDPVHSSDAASSAPSFPTATPATSPPANAAEGTHGIMCEHPTAEAVFANPENGRHVDDNVHTYTNDFRSRYAATRFPSGSNASAATRTGLGGGAERACVASREFLRELGPLASPNAAAAAAAPPRWAASEAISSTASPSPPPRTPPRTPVPACAVSVWRRPSTIAWRRPSTIAATVPATIASARSIASNARRRPLSTPAPPPPPPPPPPGTSDPPNRTRSPSVARRSPFRPPTRPRPRLPTIANASPSRDRTRTRASRPAARRRRRRPVSPTRDETPLEAIERQSQTPPPSPPPRTNDATPSYSDGALREARCRR